MEDTARLKIISEALEASDIKWWIDHGTLLGIIRESQLLSWDNDIDISIFTEDLAAVYQTIKSVKTQLSAHLIRTKRNIKIIPFKEGKDIDISSYTRSKDDTAVYIKTLVEFPRKKGIRAKELRKFIWRRCRNGENFLREIEKKNAELYKNKAINDNPIDMLLHYITKTRETMGIYHQSKVPESFFRDFSNIIWEDITLPVPLNPEKYLEFRYGSDWRTPKSKWKWWRDDMSVKQKKRS